MSKGFQLIGDTELLNLIDKLPKESAKRRVWRGFARSAARPIIKEVRRRMPNGEGNLKRSVRYKNYANKYFGGRGGNIKVRQTGKMPEGVPFSNPAKNSVLIKGRNGKGMADGRYDNWFEDAAQSQGRNALNNMTQNATKYLQKEIKKLL